MNCCIKMLSGDILNVVVRHNDPLEAVYEAVYDAVYDALPSLSSMSLSDPTQIRLFSLEDRDEEDREEDREEVSPEHIGKYDQVMTDIQAGKMIGIVIVESRLETRFDGAQRNNKYVDSYGIIYKFLQFTAIHTVDLVDKTYSMNVYVWDKEEEDSGPFFVLADDMEKFVTYQMDDCYMNLVISGSDIAQTNISDLFFGSVSDAIPVYLRYTMMSEWENYFIGWFEEQERQRYESQRHNKKDSACVEYLTHPHYEELREEHATYTRRIEEYMKG